MYEARVCYSQAISQIVLVVTALHVSIRMIGKTTMRIGWDRMET
jgi:hypothetical protein